MLAILFGALAPSISHALAAADASSGTVEICTVTGEKLVTLNVADSGKTPFPAKHSMEHCAFCGSHAGFHALTVAPFITVLRDAGRDIYPPLFYSAPQSQHAWSAAKPRGPPSLV